MFNMTQNDMSHLSQTNQSIFLTNIPFSIARKICTIAENENVKVKRFKELKTKIARTKIP